MAVSSVMRSVAVATSAVALLSVSAASAIAEDSASDSSVSAIAATQNDTSDGNKRCGGYPPGSGCLLVSRYIVSAGDELRFKGKGFIPGESVTIRLGGSHILGVISAGVDGSVNGSVTIPDFAPPGGSVFTLTGDQSHRTLSCEIRVTRRGRHYDHRHHDHRHHDHRHHDHHNGGRRAVDQMTITEQDPRMAKTAAVADHSAAAVVGALGMASLAIGGWTVRRRRR